MTDVQEQAKLVLEAMNTCSACGHLAIEHRKIPFSLGGFYIYCSHYDTRRGADGQGAPWGCPCKEDVDGANIGDWNVAEVKRERRGR